MTYDLYRADDYKDFREKISSECLNSWLDLGIYINWLYNFGKNVLEFRPGLIFGKSYSGFELGLFYRRIFYKLFYGIAGINYHYNFLYSEGMSSGYSTEETSLLSPNLGVGAEVSDKISLHVMYEITNNHLIYSDHDYNDDNGPTRGYRYADGLLRIILEVNM